MLFKGTSWCRLNLRFEYRKALIPGYPFKRSKKLKMEKILFDMDAHGPPFPKKKIFFSCDFPKLFHCSYDCILSRLVSKGINRHVKNHLLKFFWTKIKFRKKTRLEEIFYLFFSALQYWIGAGNLQGSLSTGKGRSGICLY